MLENVGRVIGIGTGLLTIGAAIGGGGVWVYKTQTNLENLQSQVQAIITSPEQPSGAPHAQRSSAIDEACGRLADRIETAIAKEPSGVVKGLQAFWDRMECPSASKPK